MKNKQKMATIATGVVAVSMAMMPVMVGAQTVNTTPTVNTSSTVERGLSHTNIKNPSINGKVSTVSGSTITITDNKGTTYTVDATNAKFMGAPAGVALTLTDIVSNDKLSVRGTVNGTSVVAKSITDISFMNRSVFSGKVTAVSGSTVTMLRGKTSYTVDLTSATITKGFGKNSTSLSNGDIKVGDRVTAVGTLTGTNITAKTLSDIGAHPVFDMGTKKMQGNKMMGKFSTSTIKTQ